VEPHAKHVNPRPENVKFAKWLACLPNGFGMECILACNAWHAAPRQDARPVIRNAIYIYIDSDTYWHTHTHVYIYICICIYIYLCMCVHVCIYMYIHVYIYICICIYMSMSWVVANLERVKLECARRVNGYVDRGVGYIG